MRRFALAVAAVLAVAPFTAAPVRGDDLDQGFTEPAAPAAAPAGLYVVTEVWAGDVVTSSGNTKIYTTVTVSETPGTYARIIDVVGTGVSSAFDGRSFNGRARLTDGRLVTGAYYETFVSTPDGFVPVSIVFFQDDSETAGNAPPAATGAPSEPATSNVPKATTRPEPIVSGPAPADGPVAPPAAPAGPLRTPAPVIARAGIALAPSGQTLGSMDVLRGRVVHLWPRAFVDGVAVRVRGWRLIEGTVDEVSRRSGGAFDPCDATWLTLPPPDASWVLRFEVTTDAAPGRVLTATIAVTVRSPALLQ
jgi:hypothetical protein